MVLVGISWTPTNMASYADPLGPFFGEALFGLFSLNEACALCVEDIVAVPFMFDRFLVADGSSGCLKIGDGKPRVIPTNSLRVPMVTHFVKADV